MCVLRQPHLINIASRTFYEIISKIKMNLSSCKIRNLNIGIITTEQTPITIFSIFICCLLLVAASAVAAVRFSHSLRHPPKRPYSISISYFIFIRTNRERLNKMAIKSVCKSILRHYNHHNQTVEEKRRFELLVWSFVRPIFPCGFFISVFIAKFACYFLAYKLQFFCEMISLIFCSSFWEILKSNHSVYTNMHTLGVSRQLEPIAKCALCGQQPPE